MAKKPAKKKAPAKKKPAKKAAKGKSKSKITCILCGKEYATEASLNKHKCSGKLKSGFKVELKATAYLKKIVEVAAKWCDEAKIEVNAENLNIETSDASRSAQLQIILPKKKFKIFNFGDKSNSLVINIKDMDKIMKRGNKDDEMEIFYNTDAEKLNIIFKTETGRKRTFQLGVLDDEEFPEYNFIKMREYEWPIYFNIEAGIFEQIVKDAGVYQEDITLTTINSETDISFWTNSVWGEFKAILGNDELKNLMIDVGGSASFMVGHLVNVLKLKPMVEELTVQTAHNFPIILTFELKNGFEVLYSQGPKVDQEDYADEDDIEEMEAAVQVNIDEEVEEEIDLDEEEGIEYES